MALSIVSFIADSHTAMTLTWTAADSASGYQVRIKPASGSYGAWVDVGNVLTHQFTGLDTLTPYKAQVRSYLTGEGGVLGSTQGVQWLEANPPSSRSFGRQVRSKLFGLVSDWVSTTVNIPAPLAPTSVAFDTVGATPFEVAVIITPNAAMNERQIHRTKVEVWNADVSVKLQEFFYTGVARTANISGRFLNAPNNEIKVRVAFIDYIGEGSFAVTPTSYTFASIDGTEISNNTITSAHIQDGAIIATHIENGIINTAHFASTIRPVQLYSASTTLLPTLPDATYPVGSQLFWTNPTNPNDRKLWRVSGAVTTNATATVSLTSQAISSVTVTNAGSGYTIPPTIRIIGGGTGSGAILTPVMSGDTVASITITNPGSGYTATPTIQITPWSKSVDASDIVANSITAGMISVGAIGASEIAAGAIRADKLAVGTIQGNLINNQSFEQFIPSPYQATISKPIDWARGQGSSDVWYVVDSEFSEGHYALFLDGGTFSLNSAAVPVTPGKKYIIRFKYKTTATVGTVGVFLDILTTTALAPSNRIIGQTASTANGVQARQRTDTTAVNSITGASIYNIAASTSSGNWIAIEGVFTAASSDTYASLAIRHTSDTNAPVYFDDIQFIQETTGVIIQDGTVTGNKLVAQTITGDKIQAGTITADKFATRIIGDNLILNPSFEDALYNTNKPVEWAYTYGSPQPLTWQVYANATPLSSNGTRSLLLNNNQATNAFIGSKSVPVLPGEVYYVRFWMSRNQTPTTCKLSVAIFEYNTQKALDLLYIGDNAVNPQAATATGISYFVDHISGNTFQDFLLSGIGGGGRFCEMKYTVPANVRHISLGFGLYDQNMNLWIDNIVFRPYIDGVTIKDDTITAPKILANSITTDKIAIGSFGGNLVVNPSFEVFDLTTSKPISWHIGSGTDVGFTSSTDYAIDGAYSAKMMNGSNNSYVSRAFPVVYGENYAISFKLRSEASAGTFTVNVGQYHSVLPANKYYIGSTAAGQCLVSNSSTTLVNQITGSNINGNNLTTLNGGWKQFSVIYTPSNSASLFASLRFSLTNTADAPMYIDDIVIQKRTSGVFIENGSIRAENLVIGGMSDNLIANGSFEDVRTILGADGNQYRLPDSWYFYSTVTSASASSFDTGNGLAIRLSNVGSVVSRVFPVVAGTKIAVKFRVWQTSSTSSQTINLRCVNALPGSGTYLQQNYIGTTAAGVTDATHNASSQSFTVNTTPTYHEVEITVPSGVSWASLQLPSSTTYTYYDDITVKKPVGQAFITDLRANQIVANTGQIGLVFADQIKQTNFTPFRTGSVYTGNLGYNFDYADGGDSYYDVVSDTLHVRTAEDALTSENMVVTQPWQRIVPAQDGYIEFTIPNNLNSATSFWMALTVYFNPDDYAAGDKYMAFDYAYFYNGGSNTLYIYEAESNEFTVGGVAVGDVLRIGIENTYTRFRKNGNLVWTSPRVHSIDGTIRQGTRNGVEIEETWEKSFVGVFAAHLNIGGMPIYRTTSFVTPKLVAEGTGQGWRLNPLAGDSIYAQEPVWDLSTDAGNISNDLQVGDYVLRTSATAAWDTSVATSQTIQAGDGWFQTTITSLSELGFMMGFSTENFSNPAQNTIKAGWYFQASPPLAIAYYNGAPSGSNSTFIEQGSVFRVSIEGGTVRYFKNGALVHQFSYSPAVYPIRGKVWLNAPNSRADKLLFAASSSGLGEFNSGITVRGKRLEDIVKLSTQALRADNRYRGNDATIPSNLVSSIRYDSYFISWEDNTCFMNVSVNFADYKSNRTKNLDSVKHVRTRVYNKFGEIIGQFESPYHGRGIAFSGYFPRMYADGKQEAVFSFEIENLYGYSAPVWYSEAKWLDKSGGTWIEAPQNDNISYSAPQWYNKNDIATNCNATPLTSTMVQVTWTKAVNDSAWSYQVYYRPFRASGYEGDESNEGWLTGGSTTTDSYKTISGLMSNTRYEFTVRATTITYGYSNIAQTRTFLIIPVTDGYGGPSGLSGFASSPTQINLSWTKNDSASYEETEIWRTSASVGTTPAVPDETATQVGSSLTGTTYNNTSLTANTVYSYRARNKYTGPVYSEWSNVITVTTPVTTPPSPPNDVYGFPLSAYSLNISFVGNNGSTTYRIQVAYMYDSSFSSPVYNSTMSGSNGTNFLTVDGLMSNTDYIIRVAKDGTSDWSITAYASTMSSGSGPYCVLETEPIRVVLEDDTTMNIPAKQLERGMRVLGSTYGHKNILPAFVQSVRPIQVSNLLHIKTKSGMAIKCSSTHKPITGFDDITGTFAYTLSVGDTLLVYNNKTLQPEIDTIKSIEVITGEYTVIELSLDSETHTYIAGGIFAHNRKEDEFPMY